MKFRSYLLPGNGLDGARFNFANASFNLLCPRGLNVGFWGLEALQEERRKLSAVGFT